MNVIESVAQMRDWTRAARAEGRTIGFVPTMGALHEGHTSLVRRSRGENELTLVSIFVNPTQFDDSQDLKNYPRTIERDLDLLRNEGVDAVFVPKPEEMYADHYNYQVNESKKSLGLCGAHRPGHFQGVLTVVLKLLNLADARRAYFGEKDFQQFDLIKGMADAFFIGTEIVPCPTVRERDGLAMSSRNRRLDQSQRDKAAEFPRLLKSDLADHEVALELNKHGFAVDYVETHGGRRFGAVHLGKVRLIDNVVR